MNIKSWMLTRKLARPAGRRDKPAQMKVLGAIAGVAIGLIAASAMVSESRAQSSGSVFLPPISVERAKYFAQHPDAYQKFLSKLPRRGAVPTGTPPAKVTPAGGGSWTSLVNAAPNGAGLYAPHLLTDGTVEVEDGTNPQWYKLTPDINGSYVNGTWSTIAKLPVIGGQQYAPLYYASAVLPDGRLMIQGGEYNAGQVNNQDGGGNVYTNLGAIYDPVADKWTAVAPPSNLSITGQNGYLGVIGDAQSVVLDDGTFMIGGCCNNPPADDLFNATTLAWTATPAPSEVWVNGQTTTTGNSQDEQGYEILPNGHVLTIDILSSSGVNATSAEQYVPSSASWVSAGNTPVSLADPAVCASGEIGPAVLRPDGTLVAFGGYSLADCASTTSGFTTDPTAIYNSSNNTWAAGPNVPSKCGTNSNAGCTMADAPAAMLPNGNILFAAAPGYTSAGVHFFEYGSASAGNTITQVSDSNGSPSSNAAYVYNFLVLPTGQILVTDGSSTPQVYTPTGSPTASWAPVITTSPSTVVAGSSSYTISGKQFNGLSQGADYGDDAQTATNYPIVQITNIATNHVFYARTFNHSTMSVAPNATGSTHFTVPVATEPGASQLVVIANGIASAPVTVLVKKAATVFPPDFNGDAKSDILWRDTSGNPVIWFMSSGTISASANLNNPGAGWSIAGTGDFNGDGKSDILWRNANGETVIWFMNSGVIQSSADLGNIPSSWTVAGIGDFNGDGKSDIVWHNTDGDVNVWLMNGATISSSATVSSIPSSWTVQGTGDLNANGDADIVWRNSNGEVVVWFMNGTTIASSSDLGNVPAVWTLSGVADFDGDGKADLLWHNTNGAVVVWFMNGGTITSSATVANPPTSWSIAATGDYNGDGKADVLWRNTNGDVVIWFMNGGTITSSATIGSVSESVWTVVQ